MPHTTSRQRDSRYARLLGVALAAGLLLAVAPGTATAATAFVTQSTQPNGSVSSTARFQAAPGEENDVKVQERSGERFDFRDTSNRIAPGQGCRRMGSAVRCEPREVAGTTTVAPADVRLGDRSDDATVVIGRARVDGDSGDDQLETHSDVPTALLGSSGNDRLAVSGSRVGHTLDGAGGNDTITGGPAGDSLGGGGDADMIDAKGGDDVVDGGSGDDAIDGGQGADTVRGGSGRDRILGGVGDDRLFGNGGRDRIRGQQGNDGIAGGRSGDRLGGGPGRDRLFGDSGGDLLVGNGGRDRYRAGSGNDRVRSNDGVRERVNCGSGFDRARVDRKPRDRTASCNRVIRVRFRR